MFNFFFYKNVHVKPNETPLLHSFNNNLHPFLILQTDTTKWSQVIDSFVPSERQQPQVGSTQIGKLGSGLVKFNLCTGPLFLKEKRYVVKFKSTTCCPCCIHELIICGAFSGTGSFELRADGSIHEWTIENQSPAGSAKLNYAALDLAVFGVRLQSGTKSIAKLLRTHPPSGYPGTLLWRLALARTGPARSIQSWREFLSARTFQQSISK